MSRKRYEEPRFSAQERAEAAFSLSLHGMAPDDAQLALSLMRKLAHNGQLTLLRACEIANSIDPPAGYEQYRQERAEYDSWMSEKVKWKAARL